MSQPKAVALVRQKVEAQYKKDLAAKEGDKSIIAQQTIDVEKEFKRVKEAKLKGSSWTREKNALVTKTCS